MQSHRMSGNPRTELLPPKLPRRRPTYLSLSVGRARVHACQYPAAPPALPLCRRLASPPLPRAPILPLKVNPAENRHHRHILHHHHHLQSPPPLPGPCERRTLPSNPPALPHRRRIQTPRLRRHARPRAPTPHPERQNHLPDHEPDQGRLLPPPPLKLSHLAARLRRSPHPQRRSL